MNPSHVASYQQSWAYEPDILTPEPFLTTLLLNMEIHGVGHCSVKTTLTFANYH